MSRRSIVPVAALTVLLAACTSAAGDPTPSVTPDPIPVKVAFFQDGSIESPNTHALPAFLGLKLAVTQAVDAGGLPVLPELVGFDTTGDPALAAEQAQEVAADPTYVAAVGAPFWGGTAAVGQVLGQAGIPTLSLSALGSDQGEDWFRLVADQRRQAEALAGYVRGQRGADGVCLAGDGSPYAAGLSRLLRSDLRGDIAAEVRVDLSSGSADGAAATIVSSGCSTTVWTGFATGATDLRGALVGLGAGAVRLLGADAMKDDAYLTTTGSAADATVVSCACVDLSAATDEAAQRFIHDYQAEYATAPAVYAAEGWDLGGMLLRAFRAGATTPAGVLTSIRDGAPFEGLATTYALRADGDLAPGAATIHLYRAEAGRWVGLGAAAPTAPPTRTEGVLTVGSCRTGAPFAYRDARGRLVGFDVEFARAIAAALGLQLGWTRTSCASGTAAVDEDRVDVLLADGTSLPAGTATSRVYLSTDVAVVMARRLAVRPQPLASLGTGDVVGIVEDGSPGARHRPGSPAAWAAAELGGVGRLRRFTDRDHAYTLLARGALSAVVDTAPAAWAGIESRPDLLVADSIDAGDRDVMVAAGPGTELLAAVDGALGRLLDRGTYGMLYAKYFPGTTPPTAVGEPLG